MSVLICLFSTLGSWKHWANLISMCSSKTRSHREPGTFRFCSGWTARNRGQNRSFAVVAREGPGWTVMIRGGLGCSRMSSQNFLKLFNKRSKDLGALLDTCAVRMTLATFCRLVSKTYCCRLSQLKSIGLTLTRYLTMHVSILDHFLHLSLELSRSLKVKCDGGIGLLIYFLLVFNSNRWPNSAVLRDITL